MKRLTEEGLKNNTAGLRTEVILFPVIDSTNSEAKRRIREGLRGTALFVAEEQSGGRGRLGRSFYSPAGTGIYMTLACPVDLSFQDAVRCTAKASVAVYRALERFLPGELTIKWVNDIMRGRKKVAGILVESVADSLNSRVKWLCVGAGVNIETEEFPGELLSGAGSLGLSGADREKMIGEITRELLLELGDFSDLSYLDTYRGRSCVIGRDILYGQEPDFRPGHAEGIDGLGRLIVTADSGERVFLGTGEVSVRFI